MKILIAPNAFKNSLTAIEASLAIEKGLLDSGLKASYGRFPIADGGDGTGDLIIEKCKGETIKVMVTDPLGRKIASSFGLIDGGKTAIIEMANASGIKLLNSNELNPLHTSSFGTGELIKEAISQGVNKIVLGMGGSATVDCGIGVLRVLGIEFLDKEGVLLTDLPNDLELLSAVDVSNVDQRIFACEFIVLCDVDNKLLGKHGAATVFGPQKGASPAHVEKLEKALQHFTKVTLQQTGVNMAELIHGGTAGGAAAGLATFLGAKLVNGIDYFLKLTSFEVALKDTDFLITGEGCLDVQTLSGKGPVGVAVLAKQQDIPVFALTGKISLPDVLKLRTFFSVILPIGNQPMSLDDAIESTDENLTRTATELGLLIASVSASKHDNSI